MQSNDRRTNEIKHYMRRDARARDKELVTEKVEIGSATYTFLQRMEERRLSQECMLRLDMRGKVPHECHRYVYRNREFWLDQISHEMFSKGLRENNDVFTVGMYEEIVSASHTFKGIQAEREREAAARREVASAPGQVPAPEARGAAADPATSAASDQDTAAPEVLPLGYYRNRREPRLQFAMAIGLHVDEQEVPAQTVDVSPHGLRVHCRQPLGLTRDESVGVTFTQLNDERDADLHHVMYRVLGSEDGEFGQYIRLLRLEDGDEHPQDALARLVDEQLNGVNRRRKMDFEDERLTAASLLAELYYTNATPVIPVFLAGEHGEPRVAAVCTNDNNRNLLRVFEDADGHLDFTGLSAPDRVRRLRALALDGGQQDPLIAVFRPEQGKLPRVVAEFEFDSEAEWFAFVNARCREDSFKVFKVLLRPAHRADCRKVYEKVERLSSKSLEVAEAVICDVYDVDTLGTLVDMTDQLEGWGFGRMIFEPEVVEAALPAAEAAARLTGQAPVVVPYGYVEQRHEDRYKVTLAVEVESDGDVYSGVTRDVSVRGMCIELHSAPKGVNRGDIVALALPELHRRARQKVKLRDIPCEVARIERDGDKVRLCLKRVLDAHSRPVTEFMRDMIDRNSSKMEPDLNDMVTAANSRLFAALGAENIGTVPLFVLRDPETNDRSIKVALPQYGGSLAEFFEVAAGQYDFGPVGAPDRLVRLTSDLRKSGVAETTIYLYKRQLPGTAQFRIHAAAEPEFEDAQHKEAFIAEALNYDHCFVKVTVSAVRPPSDGELQAVLEPLAARSPHRASKLQSEFAQVMAVGDVVDVTRQVMESLDPRGRIGARSIS